jgi:HSP90 family molecular chaperone
MGSSRQSSYEDEMASEIIRKLERIAKKTPEEISDLIENFERSLKYLNQQDLSLTRNQHEALQFMYDILLQFKRD